MLLSYFFILLFGYEYHCYADERYVVPIEKRDYQGIPYMSGGVGIDEREAFAAMGKDYSLKLIFAIKGDVTIANGKKQTTLRYYWNE
jgi:hypothetical protein